MNKKTLETICFLFIIIAFIIIGYYTYNSYVNKKNLNDSDVEINNFYDVEYLFNSGYIALPNTIEDFSSKDGEVYIYLDADNIMYIKYTDKEDKNKKVTGLPNGDLTIYYNRLNDNYYEFLAKSKDNDIYYSYININDSNDSKFSFIEEKAYKVYVPSYDKSKVYINKNDKFATNYILLDSDDNLKYIDFDKKYVLKDDIKSKKPYFDYICASSNSFICNHLMIYITFNNELVYNGETIKEGNNVIYAKDVFSTFEIVSNKRVDNSIFDKALKKYNYIFDTYIIDENKDLYKFEVSNNNQSLEKLNDNSNKVKEYAYEKDTSKLIIVFEDGQEQVIKGNKNKELLTSTIYDKKDNNDEKVLIKP